METLSEKLEKSIQKTAHVASLEFLNRLKLLLKEIDDFYANNQLLSERSNLKKIEKILDKDGFTLIPKDVNNLIQAAGELHFYCYCKNKKIDIEKVKENKNEKMPDFKINIENEDVYFEVKTISINAGDFGVATELEASLSTSIDLESKLENGANYVSKWRMIDYFGEKYSKNALGSINFLQNKIIQNKKEDQFNRGKTYLVLNVTIPFHPMALLESDLRPYYYNKGKHNILSGVLWNVAFSRIGMLAASASSNLSMIDGYLAREGVLMNINGNIFGIIFVVAQKDGVAVWGIWETACVSDTADDAEHDEARSRGALHEFVKTRILSDMHCHNNQFDHNGQVLYMRSI